MKLHKITKSLNPLITRASDPKIIVFQCFRVSVFSCSRNGMSLLLVITMLGGLLFVTSAAASLIWTVSKSSRSIGESENAYYAALTAVERALYEYEKGTRSVLNLQVLTPRAITTAGTNTGVATYTTSASADYYSPTFTGALSASGAQNQPIDTSNNLNVDIPAGKTFYLNLSTQGISYPSQIQATLVTGSNVMVKTYAQGTESSQPLTSTGQYHNMTMPISNNDTRLLIKNSSGATARIQIKPTGGSLPLGVIVTGVGQYKNTLRKVEVAKPNWVFY